MIQIGLIVLGLALIREGSKGFRSCGIKAGILKKRDTPMERKQGQFVGSSIISFGVILILFAWLIFPLLIPEIPEVDLFPPPPKSQTP